MKLKQIIVNISFPFLYLTEVIQYKMEPIHVLSEEESRKLLTDGASVSRYGDGEINIAMNKSGINFQELSKELSARLTDLLRSDMSETPGFYIALPSTVSAFHGFRMKEIYFWTVFCFSKRKWLFNAINDKRKNQIYMDSLFGRITGYKKDDYDSILKRLNSVRAIWKNKKILLVEGKRTKLGVGNDLLHNAMKVSRIIIPSENAWNSYDAIYHAVTEQNNIDLVLLVAGPAATILAFDLYKAGYQAIDLGQINNSYEMARERYKDLGNDKHCLTEDQYKKQILCII